MFGMFSVEANGSPDSLARQICLCKLGYLCMCVGKEGGERCRVGEWSEWNVKVASLSTNSLPVAAVAFKMAVAANDKSKWKASEKCESKTDTGC